MLRRFIPQPLYEAMRRAVERLLEIPRAVPRAVSLVLVWVGGVALLVSCALIVYLAAVLLARLAVWFFFL
jgi:hypothetical protein